MKILIYISRDFFFVVFKDNNFDRGRYRVLDIWGFETMIKTYLYSIFYITFAVIWRPLNLKWNLRNSLERHEIVAYIYIL